MNKTRIRVLSLLLIAVMVLSLFPTTIFAAEPAGDIEIGTAAEFIALTERNFSEISSKTIKLTADIDMAGKDAISPIGGNLPFNGTFDGQGHVIRNLKITGVQNTNKCTGLFGYLGSDGKITRLGLDRINVDGWVNTGAFAGCLVGSVTECYATGMIKGMRYTGGITGMLYGGAIENCWTDLTITGSRFYGGLFGGTRYDTRYSDDPGDWKIYTPIVNPIDGESMVIRNNLAMGSLTGNRYAGGALGDMAKSMTTDLDAFEGNVVWVDSVTAAANDANNYYDPVYGKWVKTRQNPTIDYDNLYWDNMSLSGATDSSTPTESVPYATLRVKSETAENLGRQATYEALGWDFGTTWTWNSDRGHPVLKNVTPPKINKAETIEIASVADFLEICDPINFEDISNDKILLTADIDMMEQDAIAPIGGNLPFNGTFDGQGHVIKNLTVVSTQNCTGLFGYVGTEGVITNLGLDQVNVTGNSNTGSIAGCLTGTISKCYATGKVTSNLRCSGGLVGTLHAGTIENCWTDLEVIGTRYVGGLFGSSTYNAHEYGSPIPGSITDKSMVIRNNLTLGTVTSNRYSAGLLGEMYYQLTSPLETFEGNVAWTTKVHSKEADSDVAYYGPVFALWSKERTNDPAINADNLYWDAMTVSQGTNIPSSTIGASVSYDTLRIKAETATNLGMQTTYEALNWDFEETWVWSDTFGHPVLQGQTAPTDPNEQKKYPASVVTTYVGSPKTTRAFTWNTINTIGGTIVEAVDADNYNEENPNFTIRKEGSSYELFETNTVAKASTGRNIHKVNLTELEPGTTYYYRVGDGEYWSPVYSFTTEREDADSFTFFSITDTQDQYQNYKTVLKHATENYPHSEFILHTGDVIQNNITGDYDEVYRVTANYVTDLPTMLTPGNHELNKDTQETTSGTEEPDPVKGIDNYKAHYQFPSNGPEGYEQTVYSFTYGDAYFAVLNSNISLYDGTFDDQIAWLKADMDANGNDKAWQIVSIHHGPYNSSGNPTSDAAAGIDNADARALINALEELKIDLVIYGHYHNFRGSGTIDGGSVYYYSPGCSGGNPVGASMPVYAAITITEDSLTVKSHAVPVKAGDQEQVMDNVTQNKPLAELGSAPTAANSLIFNGTEHALLTAPGSASIGTMLYSLDGKTYSETIPAVTNAGTYTVYYKAGGIDHTDTAPQTITVTIAPKALDSSAVANIPAQYYTGSAVEPTLTVMDGSNALTEGTDYTVAYSNNTAAGTATATVTFQGNYTGSATKTFTIVRRSSNNGSTTYLIEDKTASSEEGTVTIRPKRAERGTTVSITVTPDTGYVLDKLIVTDKNGNELKVTAKGNGKYSFTMPASQVAVKATFKSGSSDLPFADVSKDDWFYSAVEHVYAQGIMVGTGSTTFTPNADLSRAMVAQIVYNLDSNSYDNAPAAFLDNLPGSWFYTAVNWAAAEDVVAGYGNGMFGPMDSVTREQLAVILRNYAVSKGYSLSGSAKLDMYADASETSFWAVDAVEWAAANNILRFNDGRLAPTDCASRADVAFAMMQFCENIAK